jgi:hypothetical protein
MTLFTYKDKHGYKQNLFTMLLVAAGAILFPVLLALLVALASVALQSTAVR